MLHKEFLGYKNVFGNLIEGWEGFEGISGVLGEFPMVPGCFMRNCIVSRRFKEFQWISENFRMF